MTTPDHPRTTSIKGMTHAELERDLARSMVALENKELLREHVMFYSRRRALIEAEIRRRAEARS
jgi:hypothetical protein